MAKKIFFYLSVIVLIFGGQFFVNKGLVTGSPPSIAAKTLNGMDAMPKLEQGPGIIYFWAEWCGICKMMQGTISSVLKEVPAVTVAVRSGDDQTITQYLKQHSLQWPVVNDGNGHIAERYGIRGVPAIFFINQQGSIVFAAVGYTSEIGMRFRLWLAGVL
jgi:thiol-disulfide isomerase/thioredoxin